MHHHPHTSVPPPPRHPPPPPPPPKPPPSRAHRPVIPGYEIERELGRGGMGVVYLARQKKLNRRVALKMLSGHYGPEELHRFMAEAETAAGLQHTNIAHIYEVGENDGTPFYALEFVEGGSLAELLRNEQVPIREAVELLIRVARALHFAHQNGVVHRDMKPGNVLLDAERVPKVADFGIAKRLKDETKLTMSGAVVGTPTYMAPEQAKGTSRHVGPAADVYSLGAILYEMLTGRPPFLPDESETALTVRVLTEDPVSPAFHRPGTPRDLETICMKCLEKEPRDRYASAAQFAEDLRRFLDDETILARPPTRLTRTVKWSKRHPWRTSLTIALAVGAVLGAHRLWQWEFYERPRVEWAQSLEFVHGGVEPLVRSKRRQSQRMQVSLRLTRFGRSGRVRRVEALNPRGNPASVRRITGTDVLPNYLEGLMSAQNVTERQRETLQLDFVYSGDTLVETIASDRNKRVTWRLLWDRAAAAQREQRIARARFVDLRGFDAATTQGASHVEFQRDEHGRDIEIHFYNGLGQPAANAEGVFGYRIKRDGKGRVVELTNLGRDRQPAENRLGIVAMLPEWKDNQPLVPRARYGDGHGAPKPWNGVAAVAIEYDNVGNILHLRREDAAGSLTNGTGEYAWCQASYIRNERGEITELRQFRLTSAGELAPIESTTIRYDDFGYATDLRSSAVEGFHRHFINDASGNVVEERILNPEGNVITGTQRWAIAKYTRVHTQSPPGWREEEWFFDPAGGKAWCESGHHHGIREYDTSGHFRRLINEDHDPERFSIYRVISEPEFDPQGRMRRLNMRMEDQPGQLVKGTGRYSGVDSEFNDAGRKVREWQTGCDVETFGAPVWLTETDWYASGLPKRKLRQACDESRKPLATIPIGEPATIIEEFSGIGRLEHLVERGFDESVVGFTERETKLVDGQFQSVVHRTANGSAVAPIRALIKGFYPDAQPAAAQLRFGDQVLSANGIEIGSTHEWTMGFKFPGGSIEVLRDGKRLRIDGFEAGTLGVMLHDRK